MEHLAVVASVETWIETIPQSCSQLNPLSAEETSEQNSTACIWVVWANVLDQSHSTGRLSPELLLFWFSLCLEWLSDDDERWESVFFLRIMSGWASSFSPSDNWRARRCSCTPSGDVTGLRTATDEFIETSTTGVGLSSGDKQPSKGRLSSDSMAGSASWSWRRSEKVLTLDSWGNRVHSAKIWKKIDAYYQRQKCSPRSSFKFSWRAPKDARLTSRSAYWPFKVIRGRWFDFRVIWRALCDFLLVINSNLTQYLILNLCCFIWFIFRTGRNSVWTRVYACQSPIGDHKHKQRWVG